MRTHLASRRFIVLPFVVALIVIWVVSSSSRIGGTAARNLGFLALNRLYSSPQSADKPDVASFRESGLALLQFASEQLPDHTSTQRAMGYLYLNAEKEEEARAAWGRADNMAAELLSNGVEAEERGVSSEALAWYERAAVIDPTMVDAWLRIGHLHEEGGEWEAAANTYELGTAAVSGAGSSDLSFLLARIRANHSHPVDYQAVLSTTDRAKQLNRFVYPYNLIQNRYLHGVALRALGRASEAVTDFEWVVAQRPDDYWAYIQLGELAWQLQRDERKAERMFLAALKLRQDDKWGYLGLAQLYLDTGRVTEAETLYRTVLKLDPADRTAKTRLQQP